MFLRKIIAIIVVFFLGISCFAISETRSDDVNSHAIESLENESEDGNGESSYTLAMAYFRGSEGLDKNVGRACELFERAFEQGYKPGGFYAGLMYFNGYGVDENVEKGIRLMSEAGESGYLRAQVELAKIYYFSRGHEEVKDYEKAAYWFSKAARSGDGLSMLNLSQMYLNGRGLEGNQEEAFYWIQKAVNEEAATSFGVAGDFYAQGIGTEQDLVRAYMMYDLGGTASSDKKAELAEQMTQAQIDEAVSLSRQWQEEHNSYRPSYHGLEAQGSDGHYEYH
ncbi:tetratricopeptide repeat protein [Salinicola avicenniae]|uniref:tetratricopeptide repeat protein n=1 Tax=Salinicola avicenniae TaxID=2916836 RepID=UPI002072D158|nr:MULTISPECIES: tetratricopeptide repeat protein [unclassified Salinicola]